MLTASTAMTLGLGAAYMRWRTPVWGVGAAAFAGLAFGIDFRGISLLVAVAAFAVAATERRLWMLALIAAVAAAGPVANGMVGISQQKETATAVGTQRALEVRLALESGDPALVRACQNEPTTEACLLYTSPSPRDIS